jgi:LysM repeat protein
MAARPLPQVGSRRTSKGKKLLILRHGLIIGLSTAVLLVFPAFGRGGSDTPSITVLVAPTPTAHVAAAKQVTATPSQLQLRVPITAAPVTPQPTPSPQPTPTPEPLPTMEVRPGDTLIALAAWFDVTPFDIAAASGVAVDDYLQIGEVLSIPVSVSVFALPPDPNAVAQLPAAEPPAEDTFVPEPQPTPEPPPPTPVATPYIPPSSSDVVAIICSLPWPCDQMVRIASCESGLNPHSVNPAGYYGLFQIAGQFAGWDDALTNATFAYENKYLPALAHGDGLTPWPVCRNY